MSETPHPGQEPHDGLRPLPAQGTAPDNPGRARRSQHAGYAAADLKKLASRSATAAGSSAGGR